jgi:hypothetical protein
MHARHRQVEQDEVDIGGGGQPLGQLVQRARLQDLRVLERGAQRLAQRAPEQRVIIDDDEPVVGHARYPNVPSTRLYASASRPRS